MQTIVRLLLIQKAQNNNLTFEEVATAVQSLYYQAHPASDWQDLATRVILWEGAENKRITPENVDEVLSELFACIMD